MGQYHSIINITKKQFFCVGGAKLCEQVHAATAQALLMLLANSNGRGGGDFETESPLIGSWAGDKIVVQGDYAKDSDKSFVSTKDFQDFQSITEQVLSMLETDLFHQDVKQFINQERAFREKYKDKQAKARKALAKFKKL